MLHETSRSPRERRHDVNLQRITDTAMRMVEEGGLEALSINKLAALVDYTPGALYRYFPSKDALLAALVLRALQDVRVTVDRATHAVGAKAPPLARVIAMVHGYCDLARENPRRFGLLAVTLADPRVLIAEPEAAAPVAAATMNAMLPLSDALAAAAHAGQLSRGPTAERTVSLFALLQGVLQLQKQARFEPEMFDAPRLAVFGVRSLLIGWGGTPRMVDAAIERVAKAREAAR